MTSKHVKLNRPTNVDLVRNPLIGETASIWDRARREKEPEPVL